jgi:hypothetical protein
VSALYLISSLRKKPPGVTAWMMPRQGGKGSTPVKGMRAEVMAARLLMKGTGRETALESVHMCKEAPWGLEEEVYVSLVGWPAAVLGMDWEPTPEPLTEVQGADGGVCGSGVAEKELC